MEKIAKTYAIFMQKGGVGKTTSTSMLAYELGKHGKVVIIDSDPQGNSSELWLENVELSGKDFVSVLKENCELETAIQTVRKPQENNFYGIDLLGTTKKSDELKQYVDGAFRDESEELTRIMMQLQKTYDYILIDMPPSYGFYEKTILSFCDEIIPIIEPEDFAMESLRKFTEKLRKLKQFSQAKYDVKNLIINKYDKNNKVHNHWLGLLEQSPFKTYLLKTSKAISSSTYMHMVMQEYMPSNDMCKMFSDLAEALNIPENN